MNTDFLVYQAKSFYNAYIALDQINQASDDQLLYFIPTLVNGAFSIEITLKAILAKNQINYGKEHNLLILFRLLPNSFQRELFLHLTEKAPEYMDADKCFDELVLISNAFADWRYAFEDKPVPALQTRFLSAFANAAIWTMFSHYNVDLVPSTIPHKTDEEIDEMLRKNRETCIDANVTMIQKKLKEKHP